MGSLLGSMAIATGALEAEQGALDATSNNVANVNTPDYSRQQVILSENAPIVIGNVSFGTGVSLQQLQSVRDPILQTRIAEETQAQGQLNAYVSQMQQTQVQFSSTGGNDIGTQISKFFASLQQLSTNPSDSSLRQAVLTAAQNVANAFNSTARNLNQQESSLNSNVTQDVQQINTLTAQIAGLNQQISSLQDVGQGAGALIDQRDAAINQLSGLIDVSEIQSDGTGLTLTTSNGSPLVTGGQSFALSTQADASGTQQVYSGTNDITDQIVSGDLGGVIQARDQTIPGLLSSLDTLAGGLADGLNAANQQGFDLNGNAGGNLFVPPPANDQGAAVNMAVAITDPSLIAASSDGTPGSNGNVANLSAVANQSISGGGTPSQYYGNIVFQVGNDVSNSTAELTAAQSILQQLQDQRGSISGVSLNEEAANMVQFQQAFDAAAQIVTTVNAMLYTVINMGTLTNP